MVWEKQSVDTNGDWKLKQSELNGYIKSQFDSIHDSLEKIEKKLDKTIDITNCNSMDISNMKAQAAMIATLSSLVVGSIVAFFFNIILGG